MFYRWLSEIRWALSSAGIQHGAGKRGPGRRDLAFRAKVTASD